MSSRLLLGLSVRGLRTLRMPMADKMLLFNILLASTFFFAAEARASPRSAPVAIDTAAAQRHVDRLSKQIGIRYGDTPSAKLAIAYLTEEFTRMGATVETMKVGRVEVPGIEFLGRKRAPRSIDTTDPNLIVRFGPPGQALLLMAHYDTVRTSPGAVDNAAAVAVLLEVARVLVNHPPQQPVIIALTAREEDGLVGARALAAQYHRQVRFAIALDLLGSSGELTLNGAGKLIRVAQLRWLAQAAERAGVAVDAPLLHRTLSRLQPKLERSDHGAFTAFHIPAIHLYHRGADDELIDLTYHSRYDVAERVLPGKLDEIGKLLLAITEQAPPLTGGGDGNWLPIGGSVVIPRWTLIGMQSALAVFALGFGVVFLRRRFPPRQRGAGLLAAFVLLAMVAVAVISLERFSAAGHRAPWSHDPLRAIVALGLVSVGMFSAALGMVHRLLGIRGERRFLLAAIAYLLAIGGAAAALDGWELAWIWLLPAALLALAPRLGRVGWMALLVAVVPTCALLAPDHLREAMFQGFFPSALPLSGWIILHAVPHGLAAIWWCQPRPRAGPGREAISLALSVAAIALGTGLLVSLRPLCTPERFDLAGLSCELGWDLGSPASR